MILNYIQAAMRHATYELLEDGIFYGEIPSCQGVNASGDTLEACRNELMEVLEEWMLFRVYRKLSLPVIDGFEIKVEQVA